MSTPLNFPALIGMSDRLIPVGIEFVEHWGLKHHAENTFSYRESAKDEQFRILWMIDARGQFRVFSDQGQLNGWATPLRKIWVFSKRQCEVQPPRTVSVGFLHEQTCRLKKRGHTKAFLRFLGQYSQDSEFTLELLELFMHETIGEHSHYP